MKKKSKHQKTNSKQNPNSKFKTNAFLPNKIRAEKCLEFWLLYFEIYLRFEFCYLGFKN
ncbi:hypothetical protein D1AOALGA4SA_1185 [Olavius algarvensis Delta 1 endosymbiont]|nr:hypothetical protein D1AOALGA4SA_1185 [Olavius algarvensis Delta 1 endosymbiont]